MNKMFGGSPSGGFLGLPMVTQGETNHADAIIFGAPCATPYQSVGAYCASAPDAIRTAFGWPGVLDHYDFDVQGTLLSESFTAIDWGNLSYDENDAAGNCRRITRTTESILDGGAIPVVLGGDDSVPIPVLQAYHNRGPLTILQLDAHIDWRDNVNGERMGLSSNMRRASEMGWIKEIIQVGARGIGSARPADYHDALEWGVTFVPMKEYLIHGIDTILDAIPTDSNLFITLDIDVMDPCVVPAVIGPAPGGFSYWQVVEILESVSNIACVCGFDLLELMPDNDINGRGALVAARLVAVMLSLLSQQKHAFQGT